MSIPNMTSRLTDTAHSAARTSMTSFHTSIWIVRLSDGLLISRGIVGGAARRGKYSATQCLRFSREGARKFLRYSLSDFPNSIIMGDCGAFSYRNLEVRPFSQWKICLSFMKTEASLTDVR